MKGFALLGLLAVFGCATPKPVEDFAQSRATYVACRVADFATTEYAIAQLGFVELNKVMAPCIAQGPVAFALCEAAIVAFVVWRWKHMSPGTRVALNATSCFAPGFNTYGIVSALRALH